VRQLRAPSAAFELWPYGVMAVGPLIAGGLTLVVVHALTGSLGAGFLAFLLAAAGAAAVLARMLYQPQAAALPAAIEEAESALRVADLRLQESVERLAALRQEHAALLEERRQLMASGQVQRAALLQREWKAMREVEWEDYVVEVCRTLGATVERLPAAPDAPGTLLADFGDRRVVILTRGEGHVVNSGVVQQAMASRERHGAGRCAALVNRRFTGAAQDYAARHDCVLIGVEEFPDFVMGKTEL
jgi:hypothetical protein